MKLYKVKVTVAKILTNKEIFGDNPPLRDIPPSVGKCVCFQEGQEFIISNPIELPPPGFCAIAWADLQRDVILLMFGGSYPWFEKEGTCLTSCSDGINPVIFKLERIEPKVDWP